MNKSYSILSDLKKTSKHYIFPLLIYPNFLLQEKDPIIETFCTLVVDLGS